MNKRLVVVPLVALSTLAFIGVVTAQDIMTDGGFESQTAATLADPWWIDLEDGSGATIEVELGTGEAFEGSNNLKIVTTDLAGGEWIAVGQDLTVEENTDYIITFYLKADNNIFWDANPDWSKGYMGVVDADDNSLADPYVPRNCDGATDGAPWAPGELVFGCGDMSEWQEYVYFFNSGANTEVYLFIGTYVNNIVTLRIDGFSTQKVVAADIMTDSGFENQTAATLADPWWIDLEDGSGATIEVELGTGEAFEGSNNLKVVSTDLAGGEWIAVGQDLTVEENTDYVITFYLKADNNIYWDGNEAWSKGYMGVVDADDNSLADPYVPRCCDGHTDGAPWAAGELVFGCYQMADWREYVYLFNSGANTELYLFAGTYVNNVVTWRVDGFSAFKVGGDLGVADGGDVVPGEYALRQNYPNPFNPTTSIHFTLPSRGMVKLVVYDLIGQEVRTLAQAPFTSGEHTVAWDGRDNNGELVNSGIYFYRLEAGQFNETRKLTFLK